MDGLQRPSATMSGGWSKGVKGRGNPPSIINAKKRHEDRMADTNSKTYKRAKQQEHARELIKKRHEAKQQGPYPQQMGFHNALFAQWNNLANKQN